MRIAHFIAVIAGQIGFENNVSGHVQIPLKGISMLHDAGHEVRIITTRFGDDRSLPNAMPKGVPLDMVDDAQNRGGIHTRTGPEGKGVNPRTLMRQINQIKRVCEENKVEVLHLHGASRTAYLAAMLRMAGLKAKTVVSLFSPLGQMPMPGFMSRWVLRKAGHFVGASQFMVDHLRAHGARATLVRHGCAKVIRNEPGWHEPRTRRRVLYWRDPTTHNGMDIALDAYRALAPKYPDITFTAAVRPCWEVVPGTKEISSEFKNVEVHWFPYENGVTLAGLMSESICVFLPFRYNSYDPQLVILESLEAGVPVVTSDHRSNGELVLPGRTGALVPRDDSPAAVRVLDELLANRPALLSMCDSVAAETAARWNWATYVEDMTRVYRSACGSSEVESAAPAYAGSGK